MSAGPRSESYNGALETQSLGTGGGADNNDNKQKNAKKSKSKPVPVPVGPFEQPAEDEERTVHAVYEAIAPHFSQTRHKPWPLISSFLRSLPPNAIGIDSGAGNGKYLPVSREAGAEMIALDRSSGLLSIAKDENRGECVRGDLGFSGWRKGVFDFAISVAAIHHLSTPERRLHSVQTLIRPLALNKISPYSRFMIYVWAYEQGELSKRRMGVLAGEAQPDVASSDSGVKAAVEGNTLETEMSSLSVDEKTQEKPASGPGEGRIGGEKVQDVLVPWVYAKPGESSKRKSAPVKTKTKKDPRSQGRNDVIENGELSNGAKRSAVAGVGDIADGLDSDRANKEDPADETEAKIDARGSEPEPPKVYHRYYHLFVEGELRSMVIQAGENEGFVILPDGTDDLDLSRMAQAADIRSVGVTNGHDGQERKWMRVRAVGWEADNWWLEGEVGLFPF
ncbi:hypothetical protein IAU59_002382 [Kwoniella sp. CBS 9459]